MKQISAILCWAIGAWLTLSIALPLAFPGTHHKFGSMTAGATVVWDWRDQVVFGGPMLGGTLALGLGLCGLLPGTSPKDDEGDKG